MAQKEEQSLELKIKSSANYVTKNLQKLNDVANELFSTMSKAEQATTSMKKFAKATEKGSRLIVETSNGAEKMIRVFDATGKLRSLDIIPQKIKKIKRALDETESSAKMEKLSSSTDKFAAKLEESGYKVASINKVVGATDEVTRAVIKATNEFETLQYTIDESGNVISIKKVTKATKELGEQAGKSSKKMNKLLDMGKLYAIWNYTKRIRDIASNTISSAIDYVETENKFNVSMQGMSESGYKFVNTISETFGMAREEIMNYQSTYNNIMKSLSGITDEAAYSISESITKMAIDYSSLYNVSTSDAMTKFQSALIGSVRPIRTESGYDITETTIGEKAKELGIERPTRQLNQMEKRLLRIMVLMDQMKKTEAMGDFARTIEEPANQLKILSNQLKELSVWVGNAFLGTLRDILPYINGFVMALKEVAKMIAILFGYKANTGDKGPLSGAEENTENMNDNLGGAVASAKELKRILMGFDVLNVIQTPSESSGSGGAYTGIDPKIEGAMREYENLMSSVSMKATAIRDKIMEWLGFTKSVNEETGEITWSLQEGYTNLEKIRDAIKVIGALVGTYLGLKLLDKLAGIGVFFATLKTSFGKVSPNLGKIFEKLVPAVKGVVAKISGFIGTIGIDKILAIVGKVVAVIAGIGMAIQGAIGYISELKEGVVNIDNAMSKVITIVIGIGAAIASVFGLIPGLVAALIAAIGTLIYTLVTKWEEFTVGLKYLCDYALNWISEKWKAFTVGLEYLWNYLLDKIADIYVKIVDFFARAGQKIKDGWNTTITNMTNKASQFKDKVSTAVNSVKSKFTDFGNTIKNAIAGIKTKWTEFKQSFTLPKIKTPHFTWTTTPATGTIKKVLEALNIPAQLPKLGVEWYAQGGLPNVGEMFVAREAGPELVGTIGNKSAVVNNQQIVQAVSQGVAEAVSGVMGRNGGSYYLYIDGQQITDVVTKRMNRMGNITGGYAYGQ